ncbi:putative secreted protein [Streptomyces viridochromogenes Tue57]|uniref:Putative secreted protein n=1 Tax=Streptomyces viridochromogenes Tue57 TaxID=1160705 RepID=L8PB01_STRVR|nr:putative secreted protein [Streptomyces viridochromogenes Tue57]
MTAVVADAETPDAEDAQVEALLKTMMSVPEEVLEKGDEATAAYLENMKKRPPRGWFSLGCMGAVAVAIGANVLPAAKIVKIVRVAKRVGIKRIVSAIKAIRKGNGHTLANDLQWVGAQLLGLEGVKAACS